MNTVCALLGHDPDTRLLLVHADDMGMSHAANAAAFELMKKGTISCGSVLVPAPWFPETAAGCRANPNADVGVHLTLTSEYAQYRWRPLSDRALAPGLYDTEGYQWRTAEDAARHVTAAEAEREFRAQVQAALDAGIDVTHLDTHMGTPLFPPFIDAYITVALEFRLPMFVFEALRSSGEAYRRRLARLEAIGMPVLAAAFFATTSLPRQEKDQAYRRMFRSLKPGLNHFLVHPALPTDEIAAITGDWEQRAEDYRLFRDGGLRHYAESLGVRVVGYREVRDAMRAAGLPRMN